MYSFVPTSINILIASEMLLDNANTLIFWFSFIQMSQHHNVESS
jgi:hypothetical protein